MKYFYVLAYLMVRLAKRVNKKLPPEKYGDLILYGGILVNCWITICVIVPILNLLSDDYFETLYYDKLFNSSVGIAVLILIGQYFVYFHKDKWKEKLKNIEEMSKPERDKLIKHTILFFLITVPISLIPFF